MAEKKTCRFCHTALNSEEATHCHACGKKQDKTIETVFILAGSVFFAGIVYFIVHANLAPEYAYTSDILNDMLEKFRSMIAMQSGIATFIISMLFLQIHSKL